MAHPVTCDRCRHAVEPPEGPASPWLTCPRCGQRVLDPEALRREGSGRVTWAGVIGTFLVLAALMGFFLGCGALFLDALKRAMRREAEGAAGVLGAAHILVCLLVAVAGTLLLRCNGRRSRRVLVLGAVAALLAAGLVLVASGLIVVFATCVGRPG